eukprot:2910962-Rhodomonas_salina.3
MILLSVYTGNINSFLLNIPTEQSIEQFQVAVKSNQKQPNLWQPLYCEGGCLHLNSQRRCLCFLGLGFGFRYEMAHFILKMRVCCYFNMKGRMLCSERVEPISELDLVNVNSPRYQPGRT